MINVYDLVIILWIVPKLLFEVRAVIKHRRKQ